MTAKIMLLRLGTRIFALNLDGVWYILQAPRTFPVASSRPAMQGIFLHDGQLVPLLAPQILLTAAGGEQGDGQVAESPFTVVYGTDLGPVGIPAGQVLQIVDRDRGRLQAASADDPGPAGSRFLHADQEYPVIDVESLIHGIAPLAGGSLAGAKEA